MYLDAFIRVPDIKGKITYRTKGQTTYVEYECERVYVPEKRYTNVSRKTIGKITDADKLLMQPNENFLRYFPDVQLPEKKYRASRSCALRIGTWIVIIKIVNDYNLPEILEGMRIYSDSKVCDLLKSMDREVSAAFQNDWNEKRNHRERIYVSYDSTSKHCEAGDLRIVEKGHSKDNEETNIFNYAIAYDTKNREPLFYELYPGSINDISRLQCTIDKAKDYGYKRIGFVLDRGYFSKENVYDLEE